MEEQSQHSSGDQSPAQQPPSPSQQQSAAPAAGATFGPRHGNFQANQGAVLFVGNLPFQTPWQHVKDHFREAGNVRYTDLIADRSGRPKGSALVTMMTPEEAANAIRKFNETDFEGRRLIVRKFDDGPRPALVQHDMLPPYGNGARRRVGGYGGEMMHGGPAPAHPAYPPQGMNGGPLGGPAGAFHNAGRAPHPGGYAAAVRGPAMPMRGGYTGAPMNHHSSPMQAVDMDENGLPKPRSQQVPEVGRKLFVSNLPFDCSGMALRETFQQVGEVERAEIMLGRSGKSRGLGIVVMKTEEQARLAISEFDGIEMANRAMSVRLDNKTNGMGAWDQQ